VNAVQRFAVRLAARIAPPLGNVLRMTGGTVDKLQEQVTLYREREQQRNEEAAELKGELIEAAGLAGTGPWLGSGQQSQNFSVSESAPKHLHRVKERLAELELALEDRGWQRQLAVASTEFSRYGIQQIMLISRLYFIKNPLIRRGVKISAMYVFGRGIEISSEDTKANDVIQDFLKNPANMAEWSHSGMVQKEETKWTDGNLFVALFTDPASGAVTTRTIDALEVEEIITDPDDSSVPWYYKRRWMSNEFDTATGVTMPQMRVAWYVALDYVPPTKLTTIKNEPVMMANGQYIPVLHVKCGGLVKWHFGCPKVYSILDWARAYKKLMENWCTITAALARFSWAVETQGGAPALANLKASLATTLANDGTSIEQNPPPVTGSAFISGPGTKITPMKTAGAQTSPEEGRRILLMVAAGFGLPETFFGDASTGSLATAQSLDRPTELQFLQEQEAWREFFQRLFRYVLMQSAVSAGGKLKEAKKQPQDITIKVEFPSVLEHDQLQAIQSIVEAMTLGNKGGQVTGIDEKVGVGLLFKELGVEDPQPILNAMYPEAEYEQLIDRTQQEEQQAPVVPLTPDGKPVVMPGQPQPGQQQAPAPAPKPKAKKTASEAQIQEAVQLVKKAIKRLNESKLFPTHDA